MMPKFFNRRARRVRYLTRGAALVLMTVVMLGVFAVAAFAHHVNVVATVRCDPVRVDYTATAWGGPSDASRTNPNIGVWYSVDGGTTFIKLPDSTAHAFNAANDFSFSDSIALSDPPPATVIIRTRAQANWADGEGPGEARETSAIPVPPCPDTPTTTTPTTTTPTTTTPTTQPNTVTIAGTQTTTGSAVAVVGAESATSAAAAAAGSNESLPATGNSPIWLAAVAIAALLGGVALISRRSARR